MSDNENKPVKINKASKPSKRSPLPLSTQQLREEIIKASGVSVEQLAAQFNKALQVIDEAMEAEKSIVVSFQGKVESVIKEPDHSARLKAAAQLLELTGMEAKSTQPSVSVNNNFIVRGAIYDMQNETTIDVDATEHST